MTSRNEETDALRRRLQEQLRRTERRNRDEFRKLMDEHKSAGILTAKTMWRDYLMKVLKVTRCFCGTNSSISFRELSVCVCST